jgi:hypothetical protein
MRHLSIFVGLLLTACATPQPLPLTDHGYFTMKNAVVYCPVQQSVQDVKTMDKDGYFTPQRCQVVFDADDVKPRQWW